MTPNVKKRATSIYNIHKTIKFLTTEPCADYYNKLSKTEIFNPVMRKK
jgi:hypothetical protein